jgi:anti-sigma B factor antagonist
MTATNSHSLLVISTEHTAEASIVRISGELDLATVPQLRDALDALSRPPALVILDLARLAFADSTGLRAMLIEHRRAERDGYDFVITAATGPVRRLFQLTALDMTLVLVDDVDSAIAAHAGT